MLFYFGEKNELSLNVLVTPAFQRYNDATSGEFLPSIVIVTYVAGGSITEPHRDK